MEPVFSLVTGQGGAPLSQKEMEKCNRLTARFGLSLDAAALDALQKTRVEALQKSGRVEWGGSILPQLAWAFCDSPYVEPAVWTQTLRELMELFYPLKNECRDALTDEELIGAMRRLYDAGGGGYELLYGATGAQLRALAHGEADEDAPWGGEEDEDDE